MPRLVQVLCYKPQVGCVNGLAVASRISSLSRMLPGVILSCLESQSFLSALYAQAISTQELLLPSRSCNSGR